MLLKSFLFIFFLLIITNRGSSKDHSDHPLFLYTIKMSGGIIIFEKIFGIFYFLYSRLTRITAAQYNTYNTNLLAELDNPPFFKNYDFFK